jgi:NAD+ synthase (glutamine-hydrolysing)
MKNVKVGVAVINQIPLAWEHNTKNIIGAIQDARAQGVSILCFPELCIPGYGAEDAFYALNTVERSWDALDQIVKHTQGMIVSVGLPTLYNSGLFNTACLIVDGQILGLVAKKFLANDGIYYEPRWFRPWPEGIQGVIAYKGQEIPIGDLYFDVGGVRIGYEICEDAWVAKRPGSQLSLAGVDIILNPSGSHFAFGKYEVRKRLVLEGSRAFNVTYLYANLLGNEAGRAIYDGGAIIASGGSLLALGPRFSFKDWCVTTAVVNVDATRMARSRQGSFVPSFDQNPSRAVSAHFEYLRQPPIDNIIQQDAWEYSKFIKEEEFTRALSIALFDYLRKSWSQGFVVSLSGGADSAAVSTLCALLVHLAIKDIGLDGFMRKLSYIKAIQGKSDPKEIVAELLTTAYQASEFSGDVTSTAARKVAHALGATFYELNISEQVHNYITMIEGALGRKLTWEQDDITLQNIQARVRSPSIWMFANIKNALLLSTSNRSEAAVGYATMDGDTSGGLSPIAGIDKDFLRRWLRWMEAHGPEGLFNIPDLSYINKQQPTAELRPPSENQTDEGDLMPYALLDAIERAAIRDKYTPVEVFDLMLARYPQYSREQLLLWIERFFKLWSRNQWKRERYAPSFHLDDKNLDPKTWCRWPILSGGFKEDLAALRAHVAAMG